MAWIEQALAGKEGFDFPCQGSFGDAFGAAGLTHLFTQKEAGKV